MTSESLIEKLRVELRGTKGETALPRLRYIIEKYEVLRQHEAARLTKTPETVSRESTRNDSEALIGKLTAFCETGDIRQAIVVQDCIRIVEQHQAAQAVSEQGKPPLSGLLTT